jgi:hypothetical protein
VFCKYYLIKRTGLLVGKLRQKASERHCQIKLGLGGQGGFVASANDKTSPIQVLQNEPRDHPLGCDAIRSLSALTP